MSKRRAAIKNKLSDMHERVSHISLYKLIPNFLTLLALCLGVTSMRYALDYKMQIAVGLIIIAAILDGIDGAVARLLNATSKFGSHLDSLSDIVAFGVAPAFIIYMWSLHLIPYKGVGWSVVLFYIACSAIRLARFNTMQEEKISDNSDNCGIPMPAGAFLILMPLIVSFEYYDMMRMFYFNSVYILFVGLFMISRLPTPSLKNTRVPKNIVAFVMLIVAIIIASIILEPWMSLPFLGALYIVVTAATIIHKIRQTT
jgi:CDP-diacylglycerol---serine O-phosphatidyltransferase